MDKRLLDILCCPLSKTPLRPLRASELDALNRAIDAGQLITMAGTIMKTRLIEALITTDCKVVYRIDNDIPVMLPEEGIDTTQINDFPRRT